MNITNWYIVNYTNGVVVVCGVTTEGAPKALKVLDGLIEEGETINTEEGEALLIDRA